MGFTFAQVLQSAGVEAGEALVMRHAYVPRHEDGAPGISADSGPEEVLKYTSVQSANSRLFPKNPPKHWFVFLSEPQGRARFWGTVVNHGETSRTDRLRTFDLKRVSLVPDFEERLIIDWRAPRSWWLKATTALSYPVVELADIQKPRFPGFDAIILDFSKLQSVVTDRLYDKWQTALASVKGIYLITDITDGRHYIGKADGSENVLQRWRSYAATGNGGNIELRGRDPENFQFSILRVFDPATPIQVINEAESHFKTALASRDHGMNRN